MNIITDTQESDQNKLHYILKSALQKKRSLFLKFLFVLEQLILGEQMAT